MKTLLKNLQDAIEIMNAVDDRWEAEPENEAIEVEWQKCYEAEYEARAALASAITRLTQKIDMDTAMKMTYNPKLAEIIGMMA
jgi:uncharacterized protein YqgV (UPF0045/DUF77 family)